MYEIYVNGELMSVVYADHMNNAISQYMAFHPLKLSDSIVAVYMPRWSE